MCAERRPPSGLREAILGLLYRKKLIGGAPPTARQVAQELDVDYNYDSRIQANLGQYVQSGLLLASAATKGDRTYEITKEGAFSLWDSLTSSGRIRDLPKPSAGALEKFSEEQRMKAEGLFESWFSEWNKKRAETALGVTNQLVASASTVRPSK